MYLNRASTDVWFTACGHTPLRIIGCLNFFVVIQEDVPLLVTGFIELVGGVSRNASYQPEELYLLIDYGI